MSHLLELSPSSELVESTAGSGFGVREVSSLVLGRVVWLKVEDFKRQQESLLSSNFHHLKYLPVQALNRNPILKEYD